MIVEAVAGTAVTAVTDKTALRSSPTPILSPLVSENREFPQPVVIREVCLLTPPGPKARFPGSLLLALSRDPLQFMSRLAREHGDIV